MALTERQWQTIEKRSGVPRHVMQVLLNRGERSAQSSVSPMGATGRAQLMPQTARNLERKYKISTAGEFGNVLGGALYLGEQKRNFGNWRLAFAAYNAGPGAVQKYHGVPPYKETQDYVNRTMSALAQDGGSPGDAGPGRRAGTPAVPGPPAFLPGKITMPKLAGPNFQALARKQFMETAEGDYDPVANFKAMVTEATKPRYGLPKFTAGRRIPGVLPPPGEPTVQVQGKVTPHDMKAIQLARHYLGTPYSWGGGGPSGPTRGIAQGAGTVGFDCSGLIEYVWAKQGIRVGGTTYEQIKRGKAVNPSTKSLRPGDAVFFGDPKAPHHVGMYIGGGKFIESPHTGATVRISKLAGRQPSAARRYG
jgi:cell wall-associated NlpC family hydrolase